MRTMLADALRTDAAAHAFRLFGRGPPTAADIDGAAAIMANAPTAVSPLEVARYFVELAACNSDGEPYNAEWESRANPLIVAFLLQATDYPRSEVDGDQTPWCAAFVNWCLQRAGRAGTRKASSRSFRRPTYLRLPTVGDVAVLADVQSGKLVSSGHVGFWISSNDQEVVLFGGNQGNRISEAPFRRYSYDKTGSQLSRLYLGATEIA